jgi:CheY-like chemotaxis protein
VPSDATPDPPSRGPLVLVVEDEVLIAMDLERLLRRSGYRVLGPAATVAAALRLPDGEMPDVALLDVNLRGAMATPVAEAPRARGVPFVLASAYGRARLTAEVLAGAPSVGKPVNARGLLAALARAVGA